MQGHPHERDTCSVMRLMCSMYTTRPGMQSGVLYQVRRAAFFFTFFAPLTLFPFAFKLLLYRNAVCAEQ
jgi:hypothetical protein